MTKSISKSVVAVVASALLTFAAAGAFAFHAPFPTHSQKYRTYLVRAMDECTSPAVTVNNPPNLPSTGCLQANNVTDDPPAPGIVGYHHALLQVRKYPLSTSIGNAANVGKITVFGHMFAIGQRVQVELTLRVTRTGIDTSAGLNKSVTFPDVTIRCGPAGGGQGYFLADSSGMIADSLSLKQCLQVNGPGAPVGLLYGNVEIVSAALVNYDTGKIFARPGILE